MGGNKIKKKTSSKCKVQTYLWPNVYIMQRIPEKGYISLNLGEDKIRSEGGKKTYLCPIVYIMQNATWDSVPSTATAYLTIVCQIIIMT